jgi:pimeloyl-ACP methyl ester carboxylesterase
MSTPPTVVLPGSASAVRIPTAGGPLAALRAVPRERAVRGTALLVPGYTGSKEDFIAVLDALTAAGYEVVAVDQRGQFESPGSDEADAYTLGRLAGDLREVLDHLDVERVHLVGHSFGGLVARDFALAHPERIRSLTLLDSGPAAVPGRSGENAGLLVAAASFMTTADIWQEIRKLEATAGREQHPDPEIQSFLERRFLANDTSMLVGMGREILAAPDRTAGLAALALPLLVAAGEEDDAWPVDLQREMAGRLGCDFVEIPDCGHSPAAENPELTADILVRFWDQNA